MLIYCVEDDESIRDLVGYALRGQGYGMEGFGCADDFYKGMKKAVPDLVLLDVMLPGEDGLSILKKIREREANIPIIMMTAKSSEFDVVRGLDLGADDYVTKPFSMVLLGKRITALLRRCGQMQSIDTITFGDVTVNFSGYTAHDKNGRIDITPKEIELLKLLIEHKGLVLTRSQILDELWGYDYPIIDRTIDTYIKNLRKKLRLNCIVTVKGIGYKYEVVE
jgi:DNA-binding response OmpR family regulator